ncbi:hypothetical protein ACILDU_05935 [Capnocytophaga canimorsus]|uniref:Uncharacterized protein n=1 Tax=Capnocytophaga canis TaxID=1848903 RepID=A0A3A1YFZ2_9FLAO|nr:hypothetical protein [Capnocytophaga canis]RIY34957.1 hypothetical protein CKY20_11555 [Capnocytophaga canis]
MILEVFSLFFKANFNATDGSIFCSPEQSKLCFEMLKIFSASQNHLPLQGAENPSKVVVFTY